MALPQAIGRAASEGDFERVKAWLTGGSESAPRSVNDVDDDGWSLLLWIARPGTNGGHLFTEDHLEIARYLLSRGAALDVVSRWSGGTALHFACGTLGAAPDFVSLLVSAGAEVNAGDHDGHRALARMFWAFPAQPCHVKILEIMLRAGATLDSVRNNDSFDALLRTHGYGSRNEHFVAMSDMVASVRRHGSWKAHCIAPHRMVLRLRSLVTRGRAKPIRTRRRMHARSHQAIEFTVRQGDNGIVWNILSYWRATK